MSSQDTTTHVQVIAQHAAALGWPFSATLPDGFVVGTENYVQAMAGSVQVIETAAVPDDDDGDIDAHLGVMIKHAEAIGWRHIAMPKGGDDEDVPGMVLGNEACVEAVSRRPNA